MNAQQLISPKVGPVSPGLSSKDVLAIMQTNSIDHLPVVEDGKYIGLISCNEIIDAHDSAKTVGSYSFTTDKAFVEPGLHIFEVVKLALELELTLIPVVNELNEYLGSITLLSLIEAFARITSIQDPGAIITLKIQIRDYSLSEIARLVESNDARILTTYIVTYPEDGYLELTLKLDTPDLSSIVATFERFEYQIKNTYQESAYYDDLKERFESLMKYLNI